MTQLSFCIHAHFYQPPREDPRTGEIPTESGADPYVNWNERIHAECYAPNARLKNYQHISFNIGPTLHEWLIENEPQTSREIIQQDEENMHRFGVGNALAQPYHHTILPLASRRDKITQVAWGAAEFEHRFGRKPRGMWLPETAVDTETLTVLADQGIQFTILAPWQAESSILDVTEPYRVGLPDGREMTVFFYHSGLSGGVSFNPALTVNADRFAQQEIASQFHPGKTQTGEPQLIIIASDGELYGHHQPLRDHFLAHLVNGAAAAAQMAPAFPALWLKEHPPRRSIQLREPTSWSCHHGVKRWEGRCSCVPGNQSWKSALRRALNHLAERLDEVFVSAASAEQIDPWALRDGYIRVILGLQPVVDLIAQLAGKRLSEELSTRLGLLLEAQYARQKMYASCGWFFEDFSRIEPRNSVVYAAQSVNLARKATGIDLAPQAMLDLEKVTSQSSGLRGDQVFASILST